MNKNDNKIREFVQKVLTCGFYVLLFSRFFVLLSDMTENNRLKIQHYKLFSE